MLDQIVANHPEMVATIAVHAWWPGIGDPFYQANIDENRARITYYSVSYTPHTYFDGIVDGTSGGAWEQMVLDRAAMPSPLRINLSGDRVAGTITAEITNTSGAPVTGALRFAITESGVAPPAGSTYRLPQTLNHGMRDFLPAPTGEVITFAPSVPVTRTQTFALGPAWVERNLECVVFVQDDATKEVHQAAKIFFHLDQPELVVSSVVIDDTAGGNGNGRLDPGEDAEIALTLMNLNPVGATTIAGALSTSDANATVTDGAGTWPDIAYLATGDNSADPFALSVVLAVPYGYEIPFSFDLAAAGGYTKQTTLTLGVGSPTDPIGADSYGYYAYEDVDGPGNVPRPTYNWVEIDPTRGGPGTLVSLGDDQTVQRTMSFSFKLYGNVDNRISISSNGFLALGATTEYAVSNGSIPGPEGPPKMIAGFWTDLNPAAAGSGKVYAWDDAAGGRYIVEFSGVEHYHDAGLGVPETLQFILYNPAMHPTETGDGQIDIQYAVVSDASGCTVGIENQTETVGIQYLASGHLNAAAHGLAAGRALRFTTTPPDGPTSIEDPGTAPGLTQVSVRPNPFMSATTISFVVPQDGPATLRVYGTDGRLVRTLIDGRIGAGPGMVSWDGRDARGNDLPAGIYLYRLSSTGFEATGKVTRIR